jgi:CheY-like chemotaxis protein
MNRRVVIVDDRPVNRKLPMELLRSAGWSYPEAASEQLRGLRVIAYTAQAMQEEQR